MEEMPFGNQFENALNKSIQSAGKKIASDFLSGLKLMLSNGTEILYRRDLGERHFTSGHAIWGLYLWFVTTILSWFVGPPIAWFLKSKNFDELAGLCALAGMMLSGSLLVIYWRFTRQNEKRIAEFRTRRKPYHSMSRGSPRWKPTGKNLLIKLAAIASLVFFAPITGIAFIVSRQMTSSLAAQQQAAIRSRYMDMLDGQIEGQFLQDAIEGKCDPAITYLYKSLPDTMEPELRADMAAAAVGKPVKNIAQAPRATAKGPTEKPPSEIPQQPSERTGNQPKQSQPIAQETASQETSTASTSRATNGKAWKPIAIIAFLLVGASIAIFAFTKSPKQETPPVSASTATPVESISRVPPPVNNLPAPNRTEKSIAVPKINPAPTPQPVPVAVPETQSPVQVAVVKAPEPTPAPPIQKVVEKPVVSEPAQIQKAPSLNVEKITEGILAVIANEQRELSAFKTNCENTIAGKSRKIGPFGKRRTAFNKERAIAEEKMVTVGLRHHQAIGEWIDSIPNFESLSPTALQETILKMKTTSIQMRKERDEITAQIEALDSDAPESKPLIRFRLN